MNDRESTPSEVPWPTNPDGSVNVAHCPEHGLHGDRETCFECGKYVEPIPMVPVWEMETLRTARKYDGDLLLELIDQEPCRYDHHGYCQTHGLSERPCIQERARAWLGCPLPTDQPGLPRAVAQ